VGVHFSGEKSKKDTGKGSQGHPLTYYKRKNRRVSWQFLGEAKAYRKQNWKTTVFRGAHL